MDTKWNNILSQMDKVLERIEKLALEKKKIIAGIILITVGIFLECRAMGYYYYYDYYEIFALCFLANILLVIGIKLIQKDYLRKKYETWMPENESFYQEWKNESSLQKKRIGKTAGILLAAAIILNYIFGYRDFLITGITVLIQFVIYQNYYNHFMSKKLDDLMVQMEEINKENLARALEIERQSLDKISRSDQLRMDLITNVSHDLKTPLTSMVGYLELIKKEELSDIVRDYVDVIVDKTDKLKEMIESLFSLAKVSSGNVELHMEKFQLNRLLEQIMADMKDKIDESGLQFVIRLTEEDTEIISDNMYCYRICQNLFENVLKYSAKGTRVFIKTHVRNQGELSLEMTNTAGYFMDFEKGEILEKFVRGDKARSTEGNGLGLAIVSSYAKALGGEFDIQIDCDQFKAVLQLPKSK